MNQWDVIKRCRGTRSHWFTAEVSNMPRLYLRKVVHSWDSAGMDKFNQTVTDENLPPTCPDNIFKVPTSPLKRKSPVTAVEVFQPLSENIQQTSGKATEVSASGSFKTYRIVDNHIRPEKRKGSPQSPSSMSKNIKTSRASPVSSAIDGLRDLANQAAEVSGARCPTMIKPPLLNDDPKNMKKPAEINRIISLARKYFEQPQTEYDKIGSYWSVELEKMDTQQQLFAKRAINEILFEGQMGTLQRDSVRINSSTFNRKHRYSL